MKSSLARHSFRRAASGLTLAVAGIGFLAACGPSQDDRSWEASVAYADWLVGELEIQEYERVPLGGEASAGSAYEEYDRGLALLLPAEDPEAPNLNELTNLLMLGLEARQGGSSPRAAEDAAAAEEFLQLPRVQSALAAMQRGARANDARPSISWTSGTADVEGVIAYRLLSLTALVQADVLAASGKDVEAAKLRIDAAQMGLDQLHAPALTHASMGLANVVAAFFGPFGSVAGPGTGLDQLGPDARQLLAAALDEAVAQLEISKLAGEGDFVILLRHAQATDRLPARYSLPNDGALERPELIAWLEDRRVKCQDGLAQAPFLESLKVVRQRLARLQLALRVDLDADAGRSSAIDGRIMTAEVTDDEILVSWADLDGPPSNQRPLILKRSTQR